VGKRSEAAMAARRQISLQLCSVLAALKRITGGIRAAHSCV
jgi:hypothetical protein